jgi:aryl-alcohol dehydrogenase-like predicted oxidoreductase
MAQVAIAWSLSKDGTTAPIIGTTSLQNLEDIVGSCIKFWPLLGILTRYHQ